MEIFIRNTRNLKAIQETRIKIGNGIYSMIVEGIIKKSTLYPKIVEMRKDKKVDRKETEKTINIALKECGFSKGKKDLKLQTIFKQQKKDDFFYSELKKIERIALKGNVKKHIYGLINDLEQMSLYTKYLVKVRGLGILTSAQLIAIAKDMTRFRMPSSLWHYFGVHVVNGQAPKPKHGVESTWNPKARALLLGVIGPNFLKQNSQYRRIYDERTAKTHRIHPEWWHLNEDGTKSKEKNMHPKHGYKDGIRVMMKRFLCEFWKAGYKAKGLKPPRKPYILANPKHKAEDDIVAYG